MHAHGANAARSGHTLACGIGRRLFFAFAFSNNTVQQCDKTTTTENSAFSDHDPDFTAPLRWRTRHPVQTKSAGWLSGSALCFLQDTVSSKKGGPIKKGI